MQKQKKKDVKYCAVFNCLNTSRDPSLKFFVLPQDSERRRAWLTAIDREDLLTKENLKPKSYTVCSSHFERSAIKIIPKLHNDAVPTIFSLDQSLEGICNSEFQKSVNVSTQTEPQIKIISENFFTKKAMTTGKPEPSAKQLLRAKQDSEIVQTVVKDEIEEDSAALHDDVQDKYRRPDRDKEGEENELYAKHEVKEELIIGPVVLQKPGLSAEQSLGGKQCTEIMQTVVKLEVEGEDLHDDMQFKNGRPDHERAGEENEPYAEHEVKEVLIIGPVVLQMPGPFAEQSLAGAPLSKQPRLELDNEELKQEKSLANMDFHSNKLAEDDEQTAKNKRKLYFNCTECEYTAVTRNTLDKHLELHDEQRQYVCEECNFRFKTKYTLRRHMQDRHSVNINISEISNNFKTNILQCRELVHEGAKTFSCPQCQYKSTRQSNLKKHLRTHTDEKRFSCPKCQYKCDNLGYLKDHVRSHNGKKPFSCLQCQYKCTQLSNLKTHLRKHTGEKPFSCPQCQFKCSQRSSLKGHMRTHTGEKPFSCPHCQYKCTQKCNLLKHLRIHTGEKPFSCAQCQYRCTSQSQLKTHFRVHTAEKRFSCPQCQYRCTQRRSLEVHVRTHTNEKPFSCA